MSDREKTEEGNIGSGEGARGFLLRFQDYVNVVGKKKIEKGESPKLGRNMRV